VVAEATIESAGGANHDGTPCQPLVYQVKNVNGTPKQAPPRVSA
jgi:hypothetical protein